MSDNPEIRTTQAGDPAADESVSRDLAQNFANSLNTDAGSSGGAGLGRSNSASIQKDWALLRDPVIHNERLDAIRQKKGYIIDMDGVIYHVRTDQCVCVKNNLFTHWSL